MILMGDSHLHYVLKKIEKHHNQQRPHQGIGNVIPMGFEYPDEPVPLTGVSCESQLGGSLNHYYVEKAA